MKVGKNDVTLVISKKRKNIGEVGEKGKKVSGK